MFASGPSSRLSLEDLANDFCEQHGVNISKQGLHERFNNGAVEFMRALLKEQLSRQLCCVQNPELYKHFNSVRIKDSTRYSVPDEYACVYKGQGGIGTPAQISIQYEYDLLEGKTIGLEITSASRNDQRDSRETLNNIQKRDLLIRDLAYTSKDYLKHICVNEAFYLNRLNPTWIVLDKKGERLDFSKILKKLKKYALHLMELDVFIPVNNELLASRLIISKAADKTYNKRIKKAEKAARSKGYQVTQKFKTRTSLNMLITNVPAQWLSSVQVKDAYTLRWQIELVFKVWKSQAQINKVKAMKIERFQCQLIAKLLWLLLHWQALRAVQQVVNTKCSIWKFYKVASRLSRLLRQAIVNKKSIQTWIDLIFKKANTKYFTDTKSKRIKTDDILKTVLA